MVGASYHGPGKGSTNRASNKWGVLFWIQTKGVVDQRGADGDVFRGFPPFWVGPIDGDKTPVPNLSRVPVK